MGTSWHKTCTDTFSAEATLARSEERGAGLCAASGDDTASEQTAREEEGSWGSERDS